MKSLFFLKEEGQASHWPLTHKKMVVIPVSIKNFHLLDKDTARNYLIQKNPALGPYRNDVWVGSIAELHKNKGINFALDALIDKNVPENIRYIVIGEGEEAKILKDQIVEKSLQNKAFLLGKIENASQYLKAFDIFIISSLKEGLPYVLLEAGYAQLPVISTNVGSMPEIIKQKETGILIHPSNTKEITQSMIFLVNNPNQATTMSEQLNEEIKNQFLFEKISQKVIALYN